MSVVFGIIYIYMAILHAHVPIASLCMALLSVIIMPSFVSASHRLALDLYSIEEVINYRTP